MGDNVVRLARASARNLEAQLLRGCGDNSCRFGPKASRGMGTNGGCNCRDEIQSALQVFAQSVSPSPVVTEAARVVLNESIRDGAELRAIWMAARAPSWTEAMEILSGIDARPESFDLTARLFGGALVETEEEKARRLAHEALDVWAKARIRYDELADAREPYAVLLEANDAVVAAATHYRDLSDAYVRRRLHAAILARKEGKS